MSAANVIALDPLEQSLIESNQLLTQLSAAQRVQWAFDQLPGPFALTSSFGVQAAVSLHLLTQIKADIPVILIDTGYLFAETYQFIDALQRRLNLNLFVYRSKTSAAWQEARFGKRWEQGVDGLTAYNQENKVEPMQRALQELGVKTWFAGLRREQSSTRKKLDFLRLQDQRYVVHPIADWTNRDVHFYLKKHDLPYHPLWEKGYVSIGDTHSTVPLGEGMSEEETRFGGLKRECGLHQLSDFQI